MKRNKKEKNIIDEVIDLATFFKLATANKKYVNGLNLHEITNQVLLDYKADFELNRLIMIIGPIELKTNTRFKNMDDFESYINAIDVDYDSGDVIFVFVYKLNTPQFNAVRRSAYAKGTNYLKKTVDFHGGNCYTPTSGHCFINFIKCIVILLKKVI